MFFYTLCINASFNCKTSDIQVPYFLHRILNSGLMRGLIMTSGATIECPSTFQQRAICMSNTKEELGTLQQRVIQSAMQICILHIKKSVTQKRIMFKFHFTFILVFKSGGELRGGGCYALNLFLNVRRCHHILNLLQALNYTLSQNSLLHNSIQCIYINLMVQESMERFLL